MTLPSPFSHSTPMHPSIKSSPNSTSPLLLKTLNHPLKTPKQVPKRPPTPQFQSTAPPTTPLLLKKHQKKEKHTFHSLKITSPSSTPSFEGKKSIWNLFGPHMRTTNTLGTTTLHKWVSIPSNSTLKSTAQHAKSPASCTTPGTARGTSGDAAFRSATTA